MGNKVLYCKACGGELEIIDDKHGKCIYCGEVQPIPKAYDAEFNRANRLRIENKAFDEAKEIYQKIVTLNPADAEAHWGIVLCRYGIEYVRDENGAYLPTCHRTISTSILDDLDYKEAVKNSSNNKEYYEKHARLIDSYQSKINQIAKNEKSFDVFISFKATGKYGDATEDSILGERIYNYLTKELKLKVFFSKITLLERVGEEYEPIIYAALRSCKVMVLICGSLENINSTWVKNEWSRYLSWMPEFSAAGRSKYLVVALNKDMRAELLPPELKRCYVQSLQETGALENLCSDIDRIIGDERVRNEAVQSNQREVAEKALREHSLRMADMGLKALAAGNKKQAIKNFDDALMDYSKNHKVYWGRMLMEYDVRTPDELPGLLSDITRSKNFKTAVEYAPEDDKKHYNKVAEKCTRAIQKDEEKRRIAREKKEEQERIEREREEARERKQRIEDARKERAKWYESERQTLLKRFDKSQYDVEFVGSKINGAYKAYSEKLDNLRPVNRKIEELGDVSDIGCLSIFITVFLLLPVLSAWLSPADMTPIGEFFDNCLNEILQLHLKVLFSDIRAWTAVVPLLLVLFVPLSIVGYRIYGLIGFIVGACIGAAIMVLLAPVLFGNIYVQLILTLLAVIACLRSIILQLTSTKKRKALEKLCDEGEEKYKFVLEERAKLMALISDEYESINVKYSTDDPDKKITLYCYDKALKHIEEHMIEEEKKILPNLCFLFPEDEDTENKDTENKNQ